MNAANRWVPTGPELFYESWHDALKDDVKAAGGLQTVGKIFRADLDKDAAGRWLADRLNPDRRERLTDTQERLIMRLATKARGFSAALCHVCDDVGYTRPEPKKLEDERAALQRDFVAAVKTADRLAEKLAQMIGST